MAAVTAITEVLGVAVNVVLGHKGFDVFEELPV
jgi:hypothetical protein